MNNFRTVTISFFRDDGGTVNIQDSAGQLQSFKYISANTRINKLTEIDTALLDAGLQLVHSHSQEELCESLRIVRLYVTKPEPVI